MPTTTRPAAYLAVRRLALSYDKTPVLHDVDFDLPRGETVALLGPSGCGKTTLLRLLAGLLQPTSGTIHIDNALMADAESGHFVPPEKRGLGMVFQDYALWPHMKVYENVAFPLQMAGTGRAEIKTRVLTALERVGLAHLAERGAGELSGGQQQRVAIARAIIAEPRLVLFDEPLSNLDRELRESLAGDLKDLLSALSLSGVYVTHDQSEAFTIADRVAVMQGGRIVQLAAPETLVNAPANAYVAEFLKLGSLVDTQRDGDAWTIRGTDIRIANGTLGPASAQARILMPRKALVPTPLSDAAINGCVVQSRFRGDCHLVSVALGEGKNAVTVETSTDYRPDIGQMLGLSIQPDHLRWFPAN